MKLCLFNKMLFLAGTYLTATSPFIAFGSAEALDLSENVYKIKNSCYMTDLFAPIDTIALDPKQRMKDKSDERERLKINEPRKGELVRAMRFIRPLERPHGIDDKDYGSLFHIHAIAHGGKMYLSHKNEIDFVDVSGKSRKNADSLDMFLWHIEHKDGFTYRIRPFGKENKYLGLEADFSGDGNRDSGDIGLKHIITNHSKSTGWHIKPLYATEGYSDIYSIFKDYGYLLELIYQAELKDPNPKVTKKDTNDHYFLNVQAQKKTMLNITNYSAQEDEIFCTEDFYYSDNPSAEPSRYNLMREIESEQVIEISIQNTLDLTELDQKSKTENETTKNSRSKTRENERSQANQSSNTQSSTLQFSISQVNERANDKTKSQSKGSSGTNSNSRSTGTENKKDVHGKITASAEGGFGPFAKVKGGLEVGGSKSSSSSENQTQSSSNSQTQEESNSETQKESTRKERSISQQGAKEDQNLQSQEKREGEADTDTQEKSIEQSGSSLLNMEKTINVGRIETTRSIEKEKLTIQREIVQQPNTSLQIMILQQITEIRDYPFTVDMKVSGWVGFSFKDENFPMGLPLSGDNWNGDWDSMDEDMLHITPATIFKTLPVPGYQINQDGTVTYKVQGTIKSLKKPIALRWGIYEKTLGAFTTIEPNDTGNNQ